MDEIRLTPKPDLRLEVERHKRVEALRIEFEALLNVLMARQASASDLEDWSVIANQTRELLKVANRAKNLQGGARWQS